MNNHQLTNDFVEILLNKKIELCSKDGVSFQIIKVVSKPKKAEVIIDITGYITDEEVKKENIKTGLMLNGVPLEVCFINELDIRRIIQGFHYYVGIIIAKEQIKKYFAYKNGNIVPVKQSVFDIIDFEE